MITCVVHYTVDPSELDAFERFARRWMELVSQHGGTHHGYFLPAEGASDAALAWSTSVAQKVRSTRPPTWVPVPPGVIR
ncbi:MAG TPA: NIPSNAP family protein [Mycobacteriales bacterium]|jgi:hypothetical protein|nr:NIPSNAP family protein [Mycobacteriales bacterium]